MKKRLLLLSLLAGFGVNAQHNRCMTTHAMQYQESLTPGYIQSVNTVFEQAKAFAVNQPKAGALYTIPVVVHVVYNNAAQNLADSVILDQIRVLNEDFQRMNADTVNMRPDFDPVKGSPRIEFILAQIDPNGMPTTGITRTNTATTTFGSLALLGGSFADLEKIKSTADGGQDPWDQTRYLNIWVGNMAFDFVGTEIIALLGYATPPDGLPNWPPGSTNGLSDGVVIQYHCIGTNNPNVLDVGAGPIDVRGRTPVHEVGHYLGLRHIWGDGDCTAQDGIDDTPNADAQSDNDCDPSKNTCIDNIAGSDLPDMIENYMDYSAETCQNSFTQGQSELMHGVLDNERYDLVHNNPALVIEESLSYVQLYPNPANEVVHVAGLKSKANISVYTPAGQTAATFILNTGSNGVLDVRQLPQGIYFVQIDADGQSSTRKIVLN